MKRFLLALGMALPMVLPGPALAQTAPASCQFILGFKALHDLDPADVGDCVDDQTFKPNGDAVQDTVKGTMVWRKADNWTAFTNGYTTWINGPAGLVSRLNTDRFPWEHDLSPAAAAAPSTAPTASAASNTVVQPNAVVTITDSGFSPANVAIVTGGVVSWTNQGGKTHTAVSQAGSGSPFDTGGIGPGQTASVSFFYPGTFAYSSGVDCPTGPPGFNCKGTFTVTVVDASAGSVLQPTPTPGPSPTPIPARGYTVTIDDQTGFQPSYLSIRAGDTVTWINRGKQAHSVVNDNGDPPFNSSALMPGQQYSYNFTLPNGHYTYHSSTEPTHLYKNADGVDTIGYQFTATLDVH